MNPDVTCPPAALLCSRRQMLIRASQGGLALGALSAAVQAAVGAQAAEQPEPDAAASESVRVTDFERSCLRFRIDTLKKAPKTVSRKLPMTLNNVRFTLDARAVITHQASGRVHEFVLTSSCKSEQVWVPRDIWHQPDADTPVVARTEYETAGHRVPGIIETRSGVRKEFPLSGFQGAEHIRLNPGGSRPYVPSARRDASCRFPAGGPQGCPGPARALGSRIQSPPGRESPGCTGRPWSRFPGWCRS